jgi:hypothetical protein
MQACGIIAEHFCVCSESNLTGDIGTAPEVHILAPHTFHNSQEQLSGHPKAVPEFVLRVDRIGRMNVALVEVVVASFSITLEIFLHGLVDPLCIGLCLLLWPRMRVVASVICSKSQSISSFNDVSMTLLYKNSIDLLRSIYIQHDTMVI